LLVFRWNAVNERFQQPDREADVHRRVKQDHAQMRVRKTKLAVHQEDLYRHSDGRQYPGREDEEGRSSASGIFKRLKA
jgi:hypothetical protein